MDIDPPIEIICVVESVFRIEMGYVDINSPKVCLNKLLCKLCLVDGLVFEYIEWKVYLTEGNNFDPIEIICVVE